MNKQTFKKRFVFYFLLSFFACTAKQRPDVSAFCPYAGGDFLEYHNDSVVRFTDGTAEESKVFIIYEVVGLKQTAQGSVVRLKRYYTDINGTLEDFFLTIYTQNRVILVRPDGSADSLAFELGDNRVRTIKDVIDSAGIREVIKIVDNNATVENDKGVVFDGCLKIITTRFDSNKTEQDFNYQEVSYYKDTILVKYSSIDHQQDAERVVELSAQSVLKSYDVYAWR